ncbi:hypothetical protein KFK09_024842 [Dendrobium nobile]|uniref:Uncharacterized protein n=1 Tax=Dendrobium nobile TaxID=94219 RepID=A0A8T3AEW8_DENNO|nr:hypothetical protein KFK09_024842 [Dendrobium nobile]
MLGLLAFFRHQSLLLIFWRMEHFYFISEYTNGLAQSSSIFFEARKVKFALIEGQDAFVKGSKNCLSKVVAHSPGVLFKDSSNSLRTLQVCISM